MDTELTLTLEPSPELRKMVQTTILRLFHSLLNGIQEWMMVIWWIITTPLGQDLPPRLD